MTYLRAGVVLAVLGLALGVSAQSGQEATPITQARGTFVVTLKPQPTDSALGRMSIDKQFSGDLEGVSRGEMLAAMTAVKDSAGYVAIEKVAGTLHGKKGEFILQHSGTMNRGAPSLALAVVPDSGTGELVGLSGTMSIDIKDGKHFYTFNYAIAKAPAQALVSADAAIAVAYPEGYRSWGHVKSALVSPAHANYATNGGFQHIYANPEGMAGYRSRVFPEGSIVVFDWLEMRDTAGAFAEGPRRQVDVMVKDSKRFAATGGWGFQRFVKDSTTELAATPTPQQCFACHDKLKKDGLILSSYRQ